MNSRMLICLDLPKPIAGIWKPLLSVISGPADILNCMRNLKGKELGSKNANLFKRVSVAVRRSKSQSDTPYRES
jgi:hypothetical protein